MANLRADKFTEVIFNINNNVSMFDLNVFHMIVSTMGNPTDLRFNESSMIQHLVNTSIFKQELIVQAFEKLISLNIIKRYYKTLCVVNAEIYYGGPESKRSYFINKQKQDIKESIRINEEFNRSNQLRPKKRNKVNSDR